MASAMQMIEAIRERCERVLEGEQWWDDNIMVGAEWVLKNLPLPPIDYVPDPAQRLQVTVDGEVQSRVILDILNERVKQDEKWGPVPRLHHDFGKWLKILMEEVGEASKADLEVQYQTPHNTEYEDVTWRSDVDKELIQAAAVLVAWLEHRGLVVQLTERKYPPFHTAELRKHWTQQ